LEERNLHIIAPIVGIVHEDQNERITWLHEDEHIRMQEGIQRGNLRLRELEEDRIRLRKRSMSMDAKIKRLENEVMRACLIDKPRMTR